MSGKRDAGREELKARLIEAAHKRIEKHGLKGLRARDVTADAGCALGGMYNVFEDLDALVLHANAVTLEMLDAAMEAASRNVEGAEERLRALARAYLQFALGNRNLWAALFEHRMPEDAVVPEWHLALHTGLFRHVVEPLSLLEPELTQEQAAVRGRTLFAAVHGIVAISIEERFVGLPRDQLEGELDRFMALLAAGLRATSSR